MLKQTAHRVGFKVLVALGRHHHKQKGPLVIYQLESEEEVSKSSSDCLQVSQFLLSARFSRVILNVHEFKKATSNE